MHIFADEYECAPKELFQGLQSNSTHNICTLCHSKIHRGTIGFIKTIIELAIGFLRT